MPLYRVAYTKDPVRGTTVHFDSWAPWVRCKRKIPQGRRKMKDDIGTVAAA